MRATTVLAVTTLGLASPIAALGPSSSALVATWVVALVAGGIVAVTEARRRRTALIPIPVRAERRRGSR